MMLKRAMKGKLDLMSPALAISKELKSILEFDNGDESAFGKEKKYILNFKKAVLMVAGAAVQKFMMNLDKEQEVIMHIADMAIDAFNAESALLRVIKLQQTYGPAATAVQTDIMHTYLYDAADRIIKSGKDAINRFAESDELRMMHIGLRRFTKLEPFDTIAARRRIADKMIEENGYCF